jgi:hypothetical protein
VNVSWSERPSGPGPPEAREAERKLLLEALDLRVGEQIARAESGLAARDLQEGRADVDPQRVTGAARQREGGLAPSTPRRRIQRSALTSFQTRICSALAIKTP